KAGLPDPQGEANFQKFLVEFYRQYDKARNEGKSPADLLDPASKDYLGKVVTPFQRSVSQQYADHQANPGQPFDIKTVTTLDQATAAYHSGNITREQARALAQQHPEWGITFAPAAPVSQVPIEAH